MNAPVASPPPETKQQPPEESLWVRYSPHQELPLSGAGSFALHALGIGLMILVGFLASLFGFGKSNREIPIEPVRLKIEAGGGGQIDGQGTGRGRGKWKDREMVDPGAENDPGETLTEDPRPRLDPSQVASLPPAIKSNPALSEYLKNNHPNLANFVGTGKAAEDKLRAAVRRQPSGSPGRGGPGTDGGRGSGVGQNEGPGSGGDGTLTRREKRMLRWTMIFNTDPHMKGRDYLQQLQGVEAILAIPTPDGNYHIIRNLKQYPAQPRAEDLSQIDRIYWRDYDPKNVRDIAILLGLPGVPNHFAALMPQSFEEKLYKLEKEYRGLSEDQIYETKFKLRKTNLPIRPYEPFVISQTPKSQAP